MSQGPGGFNILSNQISINPDSASADAFGRLRVSNPVDLFDQQLTYGLAPLLFEPVTNGTGATVTHDATNRMALMTFSSTATGGKAFMQTYDHFRYQPGRSQLVIVTFNFIAAKANTLKFAGYSDGSNGIEFQNDGTNNKIVLYSDTSNGDDTVNQASWNIDPMTGSGPSGLTLDITKTQIFLIDLQALYVGRVRCGFVIGGKAHWVHEFNHANLIAVPYIQTVNLPVRCGMTCTGTVSTTMNFICCSVSSEGGQPDSQGYHFAREGTVSAGSGAVTHILSIRPKTTFNSIANRSKFILESIAVANTGNNPVLWEIVLGQAISGTTTFNDVNTTYSAFEYNTAGTISGSPAIVVEQGYVLATNQNKSAVSTEVPMKYPITLDAAGAVRALGTLSVIVTGIGGASATRVSLKWKEIR